MSNVKESAHQLLRLAERRLDDKGAADPEPRAAVNALIAAGYALLAIEEQLKRMNDNALLEDNRDRT